MKKHIRTILLLTLVILLMVFLYQKKEHLIKSGKTTVIAADFVNYSIAKQIAGDLINLEMFIPPGQDSHHFELKPSDIIRLVDAKLFLFTSYDLEPWVKDIQESYKSENPLIFVNTGENTQQIHPWLNLHSVKVMAEKITFFLTSIDEKNRDIYLQNLEKFKQSANNLGKEYMSELSNCKQKTIIHIGHNAFNPMAKSLGFHFVPVQNEHASNEPSAKKIAKLINHINQNNVEYIFTEKMLSSSFANMIENETDVKILLLNPIDGISKADFKNGKTYQDLMETNLRNLKQGLLCE